MYYKEWKALQSTREDFINFVAEWPLYSREQELEYSQEKLTVK